MVVVRVIQVVKIKDWKGDGYCLFEYMHVCQVHTSDNKI